MTLITRRLRQKHSHLALGVLLALPALGLPDVIHLTNGNYFEGVVIHETSDRIVVYTSTGEIPLLRTQVDRIERADKDKNLELLVGAALKNGNALRALELLSEAFESGGSDAPARILVERDRDLIAAIRRMPKDQSPEVRILISRIAKTESLSPHVRVQLARTMAELEAPMEASDLLMSAGAEFLSSDREAGTWARSFLNRTIRRLIYESRSAEAVEQLERLRLIDSELAGTSAEPMLALARAAQARDRGEFEFALRILNDELAPSYPAIAEDRTAHILRGLLRWAEREHAEVEAREWVERWVQARMPLEALSALQALTISEAKAAMASNSPAQALAILEETPEQQWNEDMRILWKRVWFENERRRLDQTNPAQLFKLALWGAENDLIPEAINVLEAIRVNPLLREAADKQAEQLKHDRDVKILQRAVEAFDAGLMEKVIDICNEMELYPYRESPVQKQAQDLSALARKSILIDQEKRPYIAEAQYQMAERAYMMDRLDESWLMLDTILTQYAETPAAARAVDLLPEVARALEMELLEGRRYSLPDAARVDTVLASRSSELLAEEIRRMIEIPALTD
jgi:hypothetical protein